jgi:hypothetical protein
MIDSSFVKAIENLVDAKIVSDGSRSYSNKELHNLPFPDQPVFPSIDLSSLDSLADYVKDNRDAAVSPIECQIICGHDEVNLVTLPKGEQRMRDTLVCVNAHIPQVPLGSFMDIEKFRLTLMTGFNDTPDRSILLAFISKVTDSNVKTSTDDGVTQTIEAKVGLASFAEVQVPSPLELAPIRTFIEVPQPLSFFVFRMRKTTTGAEYGLFEIPSNWQRTAAVNVKDYLSALAPLKGFTVLA